MSKLRVPGSIDPQGGDAEDARPANQWALRVLAGVVVLAPLPYGATDPSSVSILVGLLGLSLILCRPMLRNRTDRLLLGLAALIVAAYALVLHEQLSSTPWLPVSRDPVWAQMARLLGDGQAAPLSIARDEPFLALGSSLACLATLTVAFLVANSSRNAEWLLKTVARSGLAYALYGIVAYLIDPTTVLWRDKILDRSVLNATFPNRNTAALYFGVCAVLWSAILLRELIARRAFDHGWASLRLVRWERSLLASGLGLLLCLMSAMLTGSRAGVLISIAGILSAAVLMLRRQVRSPRMMAWMLAPALGAILAALVLFGGQVNERLGAIGLGGGGRLETYAATGAIIRDHPLLGSGLGSFRYIFPRYRSGDASVWGIWDRAHDTPLEFAAEMGLPLAALVAFAWSVMLALLLSGARRRRRGAIYPIAGLVCGGMILVHSLIDFSLQIPGLAIPVLALVGTGLAQRAPRGARRMPSDPNVMPTSVNVNPR